MSVVTPPDRLVDALTRAADTLQGDLWESLVHWIPSIVRRLKTDDAAYARMFELLFDQPSPGVKASFLGYWHMHADSLRTCGIGANARLSATKKFLLAKWVWI